MLVFLSGHTHRKSLLCVAQLTPFPTSHLAIYINLHESSMVFWGTHCSLNHDCVTLHKNVSPRKVVLGVLLVEYGLIHSLESFCCRIDEEWIYMYIYSYLHIYINIQWKLARIPLGQDFSKHVTMSFFFLFAFVLGPYILPRANLPINQRPWALEKLEKLM